MSEINLEELKSRYLEYVRIEFEIQIQNCEPSDFTSHRDIFEFFENLLPEGREEVDNMIVFTSDELSHVKDINIAALEEVKRNSEYFGLLDESVRQVTVVHEIYDEMISELEKLNDNHLGR